MRLLKTFTQAALALVASTLLAGCSDSLEPYYNEELTSKLNSHPLRPDWEGPAPLFYHNRGFADGSCAIYAGAGEPLTKGGGVYFLRGIPTGYHCAHVGYKSVVVTYDPKTRLFRGYLWRIKTDSLWPREVLGKDAPAGDLDVYARDVLVGVVSRKPWKLSGGNSAFQSSLPDQIYPVPETWSKPKALAWMAEINERYR